MGKEFELTLMRKDAKHYEINKPVLVTFIDGLKKIMEYVDFLLILHNPDQKQFLFRWDFQF